MCEGGTDKRTAGPPPQSATIAEAGPLNETQRYLRVTVDHGPFDYLPGQFAEVSVPGLGVAPVSIISSPTFQGGIELVVRRTGPAADAIQTLQVGDKVALRGPLGRGRYPVDRARGKHVVFICSGVGQAAQRSFIHYVLDHRADYGEVAILVGAKGYDRCLLPGELEAYRTRSDIRFLETLDRPDPRWSGPVGVVTNLIPRVRDLLADAVVSVCGPPIMYKFVIMALADYDVPFDRIYLNLEHKIRCGVGECGRCRIGRIQCCVDGPVLTYADLASVPEAF